MSTEALAFPCSLSGDELAFIAGLDYGQDAERHLVELRRLIFEQAGVLSPTQGWWYPHEVVELGAHWLQAGHEREFAACTLLVIASVVAGRDICTDLDAKLDERAEDYDRLPANLRDTVLAAYVHAARGSDPGGVTPPPAPLRP